MAYIQIKGSESKTWKTVTIHGQVEHTKLDAEKYAGQLSLLYKDISVKVVYTACPIPDFITCPHCTKLRPLYQKCSCGVTE